MLIYMMDKGIHRCIISALLTPTEIQKSWSWFAFFWMLERISTQSTYWYKLFCTAAENHIRLVIVRLLLSQFRKADFVLHHNNEGHSALDVAVGRES
jgi:hypothetical protein